nr:hypothetical protein [Tanacetum cinerariifolium]
KNVFKDLFPKSTEFNADDYAVLVSRLALFWKFLKPFLCLTGISRYHTLDEDTYPTFIRDNGMGGCLLMCIVQHVADPTKVKVGERECVEGEARILDLPVNQVDSTGGGGQEAEKLRGTTELLANMRLVPLLIGVTAMQTLPMVTSLVYAIPEHEIGAPADSITGLNVRPDMRVVPLLILLLGSMYDVVPPVITEAVVTSHAVDIPLVLEMGVKVTSLMRASLFQDSDPTEIVKVDTAGPSYFAKKDLLMGSRELNSKTLHQVLVSQWNVLNDSLLYDYDASCKIVDHLAPPALFSQICEMEYNHLFIEFNVGTARQACLNAEVRIRTEYCLSEKKRSESECEKQADLLNKRHASEIDALKQKNMTLENKNGSFDEKFAQLQSLVSSKDLELKELNAIVSSLRSQKYGLVSQVHELDVTCSGLRERLSGYDNLIDRLEEFQDAQLKVVNDKVAKLDADLAEMACHLEEKFYPHLLTTISNQRWLLMHGLKLVVVKCLNSSEYLTALGVSISRSIEKKMQDVHKDDSVEDIMNLLRLKGPLANAPGIGDLQHDIEQLKVLVQRSEDHVVLGETSLSFDLNVSHSCIEQIRANITVECVPDATVTTMILSTTFVSPSSIPPITVDDYEIVQADGQEIAQGNVQGNAATIEFEKEDLDTTPEHELLCYTYFVTVLPCFLYCFCVSRPLFSQYWACNTSYVLELIVRAFVTSYGPSHLDPSLPPSSAWLASLFWYTKRSKLISKPSSFYHVDLRSSQNLTIVRCAHRTCEISSSQFLILSSNRALIPSPKLLFALSTKPLSCGCLTNGPKQRNDGRGKTFYTKLHLSRCTSLPCDTQPLLFSFNLVEFLLRGGQSWWTQSCLVHLLFCSPPRPAIKASYYASLLVAFNLNLRAYVNSVPFGFGIIRSALEPSMYDDPSMKSIYGSKRSSLSPMGISGGSSPRRSIMKSARSVP